MMGVRQSLKSIEEVSGTATTIGIIIEADQPLIEVTTGPLRR
jgi:hypothetical protein